MLKVNKKNPRGRTSGMIFFDVPELVVKAIVHDCNDFFLFHVLADEYKAYYAVPVFFVPHLLKLRIFFENLFLDFFGFAGEPAPKILGARLFACLLEKIAVVTFVTEPEESLGTDDAVWIVVQEFFEFFAF